MILLSWNCRGLGNPRAIRDLCRLVRDKRPTFLFLMETKSSKSKMEFLRVKLGFDGLFVVDPVGRSGGLCLLWKEKDEVEIQNYTRRHINAIIKHSDNTSPWRFTGFYGHPNPAKRHESWTLLRHLKHFGPEPWLCVGDFNEVVEQDEKYGGLRKNEGQMRQFRDALAECELTDLGYSGTRFTWTNCQHDGYFIKERLDRAVANVAWCNMHRHHEVKTLASCASDHKPLLLQLFGTEHARVFFKKSFKVEAS
jgi:exonuclease III